MNTAASTPNPTPRATPGTSRAAQGTIPADRADRWSGRFTWIIALLATVAVMATIDPAGSYPEFIQGPGITLDEVFNVEMGVYQWHALCEHGWKLWAPEVRDQVFADGAKGPYNPDHPPLGRLWLGFWHDVFRFLVPPVETGALTVTACARFGSAVAFGLTVLLVGRVAGLWFGRVAGWSAALALALMPRVFAHAHLAALETVMNLAFTAAVLFSGHHWGRWNVAANAAVPPRHPWLTACGAGALIGAAFLTKMQAVLLPVPIAVWVLIRWSTRGLLWLIAVGAVAALVFVLGWPWLLMDPVARLGEYFGRGVERQTLYCWYFGQRYADVDVPWHYPFVMFVLTQPLGILLLGAFGAAVHARKWAERTAARSEDRSVSGRCGLLVGTCLFVLAFFAMPGITVYDGIRLFLVVCPLWALLAGAGMQALHDRLVRRWSSRRVVGLLAVGLVAQGIGIVRLHPCQLSHYSLLVGGLAGAGRLGMERSYWQDSLTREFWQKVVEQVPEGATLYLAPRLHRIQEHDLLLQSPILAAHRVQIRPYDDRAGEPMRYVIVFRRRADPWASLEPAPAGARLLAEVSRGGVQLAAAYELPAGP